MTGRPARRLGFLRRSTRTKARPQLLFETLERRYMLAGDIWSQRGGDAGHTSFVDVPVNPASITEVWFQELNYTQSGTGSWRERAVAIDQSHVYRTALEGYAPSGTYHVIAYDLQTGAEVWHNTLAGRAFEGVGEPSVAGGVVYVNRAGHSGISGGTSSDLPRLYGFDAVTGATVLQQAYAAQWGSNERPVIEGDQLIVEDGYYGGISAYQASTLTEQWFVGRSAAYDPPFAALNDEFAFAFGDEVYRRSNGARLPDINHPSDNSSETSPMVADSGDVIMSYTGSVSGSSVRGVASFDGTTHAHQWSFETATGVSHKAVGNGMVAATAGTNLHILDETDGSPILTWSAGSFNLGEVLLTQTHAFVISLNFNTATVHAVDLATGNVDWSHSQNSPGGSALVEMAMSQGYLLLSDRAGVRAFAFSNENQPPDAVDDAASTDEDASVVIDVLANDVDPEGAVLTITATTDPDHGTLTINPDGTISYAPDENYHGADSFTYTIADGDGGTDTATVSMTVVPVNDDPEAADAVFSIEENSPNGSVVGVVSATDVDGDPLSFALTGADAAAFAIDSETGTISVADAALLDFETHPRFDFTVLVSDANGGGDAASVRVNLLNVREIEIDVLPDDPTNTIRLNSTYTEVAILANSDLDPLTMLDLSTIRLGAAGVASHRKHGFRFEHRDVNGDGVLDLVLLFKTSEIGLQVGDESVELQGSLKPAFGGESFSVTQQVSVLQGNGKSRKK